jgi:4-hydroxy-3-polyprenylbenzoate decarboxylase
VKERHPREVLKTAMALLGTGQLSLTKVLVLVGPERDPGDFRGVLRDIAARFDPEDHMWLLPFAPLDTLDFTSFKMHVGSKLVLDATGERQHKQPAAPGFDIRSIDGRIDRWKVLEDAFLVASVRDSGREVLANLLGANPGYPFVIVVSSDVNLDDDENLQWGIFTRFDPARDMLFAEQKFLGARPVYRGPVGIDATWKKGYPAPLEMDGDVVRRVSARWAEYWK